MMATCFVSGSFLFWLANKLRNDELLKLSLAVWVLPIIEQLI
jgi:hypothetical protein